MRKWETTEKCIRLSVVSQSRAELKLPRRAKSTLNRFELSIGKKVAKEKQAKQSEYKKKTAERRENETK